MPTSDDNARFCADVMAGLADAGVTLAIVSPGSRNTPLTLAATSEPRLDVLSIRDERSAGFVAVGHAKATGMPAAVICTSGSAATHYYPAIVEADQSTTPLIALTADRPVRLRDTFAPQTMNQVDLFGDHVITSVDVDVGGTDGRTLGRDAVSWSTGAVPGPVHVNVPLDEPLTPSESRPPPEARPTSAPRADLPTPVIDIGDARRVAFVVSGPISPQASTTLAALAHAWHAPILADAQTTIDGSTIIDYPDLLAGARASDGELLLDRLRPDHVVRIGPLPTSKPLWLWLETCEVPQSLVNPSRLTDPLGTASVVLARPADALASLRSDAAERGDPDWLEDWLAADLAIAAALPGAMANLSFPNEAEIARIVAGSVGIDAALFMASSMPIRDVDGFAPRNRSGLRVANRGVNGIDGNLSTALGLALTGSPTTALVGDVAALHDIGVLSEAARLGAPVRFVVVNNDGGGIFSFLPQATSDAIPHEEFEALWGTPHGLSIAPIATAMGLEARTASTRQELADALRSRPAGPELIEIRTERTANVDHHRAIRDAVDAAIGSIA